MTLLLTLAVFLIVATGSLAAVRLVAARSPLDVRLEALTAEAARRTTAHQPRRAGLLRRFLISLGYVGLVGNEHALQRRLRVAGFRGNAAVRLFLGVRTMVSFGPALLVLVPRVSSGEPVAHTLGIAAGVFAFGHLACNFWLRRRSGQRIHRLSAALPDSLDLMVVCLEAGLGLNATIARVGEERSAVNDELGDGDRAGRARAPRGSVAGGGAPAARATGTASRS